MNRIIYEYFWIAVASAAQKTYLYRRCQLPLRQICLFLLVINLHFPTLHSKLRHLPALANSATTQSISGPGRFQQLAHGNHVFYVLEYLAIETITSSEEYNQILFNAKQNYFAHRGIATELSVKGNPSCCLKKIGILFPGSIFFLHKQGQDNIVFIKWCYIQMLCTLLLYKMWLGSPLSSVDIRFEH